MTARDDKKVALPEPACWGETRGYCVGYTAAQLESYAAARVAEATAELRTKLAESEASDAESVALYRSARARADELQRRVAELEATKEPDQALLISMATCLNHGFGLLAQDRQTAMLHDMRKLWDEVVGRGYYSPERAGFYLSALNNGDKGLDAILADREGGKA